MTTATTRKGEILQDPPFMQKLLGDTRFSWLWLVLRVWVGYQWINAASHKITSPAWMVTGAALKGFWTNALKIADPARPTIAFGWYRSFIQFMVDSQSYVWFAKLVAVGELLIGVGLILGAFTGIAAFFGAVMNWNFMMAGSASINPMLIVVSIALVLAWKIAGYIGADFFLLRWIGTPWQPVRRSETGSSVYPAPKPAPGD